MIVKPYAKSLYLEALIHLNKRLKKNNKKYVTIQDEMNRKLAGDFGEETVMNMMKKVHLPYKFYVFHDISLYGESLFQMDVLMISPYYAVIFEVKNIRGEIEFKSTPFQLVRTLTTGETHFYDSPEIQLNECIYQLNGIFRENGISIPIYGAIVFAFTSSYIKTPPSQTTLLFRNEIRPYLRNIETQTPLLSNDELDKLKNFILKKNANYQPFPLSTHFSIHWDDINKGVECNRCNFLGMKKISRRWLCPNCSNMSNNAHEQTIKEYFLIYKNTISNKECREFFHLSNIYEANKILKNANLIKKGKYKNAIYTINFPK